MKTGLFFLLAGTIFAGLAVGITATDSWFLAKAGADNLPLVYLATPVVMVLYTLLVTALIYMTSMTMVLLGSLVVTGATACTVGFLLSSVPNIGEDLRFIFGVKLFVNVWLYAAFTQMWNFISGYIDTHTGKRLFPRFNAASASGLMIGAGSVAALSQKVPPSWFYFIWGILCFISAVVTAGIAFKVNPLPVVESPLLRQRQSWIKALGALLFSRYAFVLGVSAMVLLGVTVLCEWLSFRHFNGYALEKARASLPIGASITDLGNHASRTLQQLFGSLGVITGGLVLVSNLCIFSPLIKRIGVGNTILIQPILYASAFVALALAQGFYAAVWSLLVFQGFFVALDANTRNFLFNGLPSANRVTVRNFIEGVLEPWAAAMVGLFLFWGAILPDGVKDNAGSWLTTKFGLPANWLEAWGGRTLDPTEIAVIAFVLTVVAFVCALLIRWLYPKAIAANFLSGGFRPSVPATNGIEPGSLTEQPTGGRQVSNPELLAASYVRRLPACPSADDATWRGILALEGPLAAKTIFKIAHKLTALGTLQALERLKSVGPIAVPWCMGVLKGKNESVAGRLLAVEALAKISPYQLEAAFSELLDEYFAKAQLYRDWSGAATYHRLTTIAAVAEKLKAAEIQVILALLHHTGRIPAPLLVRLALASNDVQERADMLETLAIATDDPDRCDLIVNVDSSAEPLSNRLKDLLMQPVEEVPEPLAAAIVWDLPEWGVKWPPLSIVLSAEREAARFETGPWLRRLALAASPITNGASWDAVEIMASETTTPSGDSNGLWITTDSSHAGPIGTCLNPGWLAGQTSARSVHPNGTQVLELSSDWLKRFTMLCPDVPLQWVSTIRQSGF